MKKIGLLTVLATLISTFSFAQSDAIATHFNDFLKDDRFTNVYVNPKLFKMISKVAPEEMDADVRTLIANLEGLRILSSEGTEAAEIFNQVSKKLPPRGYDELMSIQEGANEEVRFYIRESGSKIAELLMVSGEPNAFNMISFVGDIDLQVLSKLSNNLDVKGAEHLKELKNK